MTICTDWHDVLRRHDVFCRRVQQCIKGPSQWQFIEEEVCSYGVGSDRALVFFEMAAIHTSLLYELESKGDTEREISDKIQSDQLGMLMSDLAMSNIDINKWQSIPTCTSNVPINHSVSRPIWDGVEDWKCNTSQRHSCPSQTSNSELKRGTGFISQEALLSSYIYLLRV